MSSKKNKSPWKVFAAIVLAFIVGNLTGTKAEIFGISYYSIFDLLGTLFIHALTLIVVPLVLSSIISGISRIGGDASFKKIGLKTLAFYIITSLSAVLIGLLCVHIFQPGHSEALKQSLESQNLPSIGAQLEAHEAMGISQLLLSIIPSNILDALARGNMLGLIFFGLLFGYALSKVPSSTSQTLQQFFQGLFQTMIQITHIIMKCLPLGVFCLVAKVAATTGYKSLASLGVFFITVLIGLLLFSLVVLPLFLKYIGKLNPITHFKAMAPALITAFSTSSSSATLPITIECVEKRAGVSNRICSLVVPLGNSLNMAGSALYECVGALFIAQVYGIELTFSAQVIFVLLALVTSMGVAGIPAASLVAIVVILKAFGLPPEGIALFMAVDRILDMCRTTVNVLSDTCCAVLVAKSEGEPHILTKKDFSDL
ncbi:MAG: dicarboxylate/amino acid:cation symporter [Rhabdochlamydiaceae bacterium]|nr:dicarboxylate/amino acid:cation symporter [Rhabdochlamydiaceae bacterium]